MPIDEINENKSQRPEEAQEEPEQQPENEGIENWRHNHLDVVKVKVASSRI